MVVFLLDSPPIDWQPAQCLLSPLPLYRISHLYGIEHLGKIMRMKRKLCLVVFLAQQQNLPVQICLNLLIYFILLINIVTVLTMSHCDINTALTHWLDRNKNTVPSNKLEPELQIFHFKHFSSFSFKLCVNFLIGHSKTNY